MAPDNTITTIIFDLGRVLVDFDHMELCRRASTFSPYAPDEVYARMFHSGLIERFETGRMTPDVFFRETCIALDMHTPREEFETAWNTIFSLNRDTARIIERLQDFQLLLLSNTNHWHFNYCLHHYPVLRLFDGWILSYETGVCKPDKKIFDAALSKASARPQECIFIDDIERYSAAARGMGMHAHTFKSAQNLEEFLRDMDVY